MLARPKYPGGAGRNCQPSDSEDPTKEEREADQPRQIETIDGGEEKEQSNF